MTLRRFFAELTPSKRRRILIVLLLLTAMLIVLCNALRGELFRHTLPKDGASFVFFSVGQANSAVIRTSAGNVMIDTGSNASANELLAALAYYRIDSLELLVLSHADEDHAGGFDSILKAIPVARVMMTEETHDAFRGTVSEKALQAAIEQGTTVTIVTAGDRATVGELVLRVIAPKQTEDSLSVGANESSLILLASYGDTDAVFPGDADIAGENRAAEYLSHFLPGISVEILLVAHHGSSTSSGIDFLETLQPEYAVISCGKNNSYGHPTVSVLSRIQSVGAEILRTDQSGTVILHSDGSEIKRIR